MAKRRLSSFMCTVGARGARSRTRNLWDRGLCGQPGALEPARSLLQSAPCCNFRRVLRRSLMEQSCHKCGQVVEEGVAFCPHCSAPQIRVVVAEPVLSAASTATLSPAPATPTVANIAIPVSWSQSVRPCALAALIAAVTMVLKLVVPLIAVLGAGVLAVAFLRGWAPGSRISAGAGARLGALCGFLCFGMAAILESLKILLLHQSGEVRRVLFDGIQQTAARYPDPQFQPTWEFMRSPEGLVFMMVFLLIFAFVAFLILGALGGALGGAIFGRRNVS